MTTYVLCKTDSLAVFKVTARDQGHYKGPSGYLLHTVTFLVSFQNNSKNLDLSFKMDLELWDFLGRVKLVLYQNFTGLI